MALSCYHVILTTSLESYQYLIISLFVLFTVPQHKESVFSWLRHRPDIILISASYQLLMRMMQPSRLCRCLVLTWRHMNIIITSLVIGRDSEGVHMVCTQGLYECCMIFVWILYDVVCWSTKFDSPQNYHKIDTSISHQYHINVNLIKSWLMRW